MKQSNKENHYSFNKYFLTSVGAVSQIFALGLGAGVIGVLARNGRLQ